MVFRSISGNHMIVALAVGATLLFEGGCVSALPPCFKAQMIAETLLSGHSCGQSDTYSCPVCSENYDLDGGDYSACLLDHDVCKDGVCATIWTTGSWQASLPLSIQSVYVAFTSGLQGSVSLAIAHDPLLKHTCYVNVNDQPCASCEMRLCDAAPFFVGPYANCTNHGQGIYDHCDGTNSGSPGNVLKHLRLPEVCGSGAASTNVPTREPSRAPTKRPTIAPKKKPTRAPLQKPTSAPKKKPTRAPSKRPTSAPTCKAVGKRCTARMQCCQPSATTCDGPASSNRTCTTCKARHAACARTTQCCLGLTCSRRRCR